jgi:hypothetical protein
MKYGQDTMEQLMKFLEHRKPGIISCMNKKRPLLQQPFISKGKVFIRCEYEVVEQFHIK